MLKVLRWIGIVLLAIFLLAIVAFALFAKQLVEYGATRALGRDVEIAGKVDIDYSLVPTIHANQVRIDNADWGKHENILESREVTLTLDLRALLDGRVVLPQLSFTDAVLHLEESAGEAVNWNVAPAKRDSENANKNQQTGEQSGPSIKHLSVKNGRITYLNHPEGNELTATIDALEGQIPQQQPVRISANGTAEGHPYRLEGSAGPLQELRDDAQPYPVRLNIRTDTLHASAEGTIASPSELQDMDLKLMLEGSSLAPLLPGENPSTMNQPFKFESRLTSKGEAWRLSNLEGQLGQSSVRGDILLDMGGPKPFVQADVQSRKPNVDFLRSIFSASSEESGDASFDLQELLSKLTEFNADVQIESREITGAEFPFDSMALELSLNDGLLIVDPLKLGFADGKLIAEFRLDVTGPAPSGRIAVQMNDVPVRPLLESFMESPEIGGMVGGKFTVAFSENSIGTADGRIRYFAPKQNTDLTFKVHRVQEAQEWQLRVNVAGKFRDAPAQASFTGQPLRLLNNPDASVPVNLEAALGKTKLDLKGTVAEAGKVVDLDAAVSGPGTKRLSRIIGHDLPKLPRYAASGHVTRNHDSIKVEDLKARVGKSDLAGSATVKDIQSEDPYVQLDLTSKTLAYSDFDQLRNDKGDSTDWLAQLDKADADVQLKVNRAIAPEQTVFRDIRVDGQLRDGVVNLEPLRFKVGGGSVDVNASLRADREKGLRGSIQGKVEQVRLGQALKPLGLGEKFPGWLNADIDVALGPKASKQGGKSTLRYNDKQGTDLRFALSQKPNQTVLDGKGKFLNEPFQLSGTAAPLSQLAGGGRYPFDVDFNLLETRGQIAGSLNEPLQFNGLRTKLELSGPTPRRAEPVVGFRLPELPPYHIKGDLFRKNGVWRLTNIKGTVGDSDISGRIMVDNKEGKPYVKATLHSDLLDFDDLAGVIGGTPGDVPGEVVSKAQRKKAALLRERGKVLPDEDFEFDALSKFNADITYNADRVDSDLFPLDDLALKFSLKDGRLLLTPVLIGAAGGKIKANIRLVEKPGERPVRGKMALQIDDLHLGPIFDQYDIADDAAGTISGQAMFQLRGESVAKMLASLDGDASLNMAGGKLDALLVELGGLDGGEAFLLWLGKEQSVRIRCASIEATARNGILGFDTAVLDTTDTKFIMDGKINFADEILDLRLNARPKDFSVFAARTPFLIEGRFRNPELHPSWENLIVRGVAALALATITPPAALLAFIEPGPGENVSCDTVLPD